MPITLTPYISGSLSQGHTWVIADEDLLAQLVAKTLVGKQMHVEKILAGIAGRSINFTENAIDDAITKLTLTDPNEPHQRDGLIFQIFSWLAAFKAKSNDSIIRAPHLVLAQKGFDGLQIDIEDGMVQSVVIFEDKATENPRKTIREKVWPEFSEFYKGQRESELQQEVTTMLCTRAELVNDLEGAIETILWNKVRKFRVAITAESSHMTAQGIAKLFKGYDEAVPAATVDYRAADCIAINDLRVWMQSFCDKVIVHLTLYKGAIHV